MALSLKVAQRLRRLTRAKQKAHPSFRILPRLAQRVRGRGVAYARSYFRSETPAPVSTPRAGDSEFVIEDRRG